ncbi:MAG: helix-turn-helix transcriptional regulator [Actinobacteria bacterium]|nr:helix-turn-helix transcriptional regulator [Actinomycetota bacterium]MCB9389023.1 helix-turn-helix transcriptional regulator [Acidimicrobiia bacterium]
MSDSSRVASATTATPNDSPSLSERPSSAVAASLEVIGERWSLLIVREAFLGARRFEEFQARLGIARNMLATRLKSLVAAKVLNKRKYQDRPARYEYRLTQRGADLAPMLLALDTWGAKYLGASTTGFIHVPCGSVAGSSTVCAQCGQPISAFDMALIDET